MSDSDPSILTRLMQVIEARRRDRPEHSYTTQLFEGGVAKIGSKVSEESGELVQAAFRLEAALQDETTPFDAEKCADLGALRTQVVHEAADLFFHTLVLLARAGLALDDVEAELGRRFGVSGLDEKASRGG